MRNKPTGTDCGCVPDVGIDFKAEFSYALSGVPRGGRDAAYSASGLVHRNGWGSRPTTKSTDDQGASCFILTKILAGINSASLEVRSMSNTFVAQSSTSACLDQRIKSYALA